MFFRAFPCFSSVFFTQFCQLRTTPLPYLPQTSCLTPKPWIQPPVVKLHFDGQTGYVHLTLSWRINFEELPKFCTLVILRAEKCSEVTYRYMEYKTMDSAPGSSDNERHNFKCLMLMTHRNIFLMRFLWKAWQKGGIKRLILNTGKFTFPNRREL